MTVFDMNGKALEVGDDVVIHYDDGSHSEAHITEFDEGAGDGYEIGVSYGFDGTENFHASSYTEFVDRDTPTPELTHQSHSGRETESGDGDA